MKFVFSGFYRKGFVKIYFWDKNGPFKIVWSKPDPHGLERRSGKSHVRKFDWKFCVVVQQRRTDTRHFCTHTKVFTDVLFTSWSIIQHHVVILLIEFPIIIVSTWKVKVNLSVKGVEPKLSKVRTWINIGNSSLIWLSVQINEPNFQSVIGLRSN